MITLAPPHPTTRRRETLSEEHFDVLRTLVYDRTGIFFQSNKKYLFESRICRRMRSLEIPTFDEYYEFVRSGGGIVETPCLVNELTINETCFFRNLAQFELLAEELLPGLAGATRREGRPNLHLWSAGCSTGDEAYSLAMVLKAHLIHRYPTLQFSVTGTDINSEVLASAREGIYADYAMRNVPERYRRRYFERVDHAYSVLPAVHELVTFSQGNLIDRLPGVSMRSVDLVVCANVLIYFDMESKRRAAETLYNALRPGGFLLLSPSESLYGVTDAFTTVRFDKIVAYRKD